MNTCQVSLALIFLCFLITFNVSFSDSIHFIGDVFVNCGSTGTSSARGETKWLADVQPGSSSLLQIKGLSTTSTVVKKLASADPVPYKTARVSRSQFSYAFQVKPGQKIIRLHFNPAAYRGFKGLKDLFTVEAGPYTLLSNFSASLTANVRHVHSLTKEFCLNIRENQLLDITFSAETSQSPDAYAFINGIEIISVPASLSYLRDGDIELQVVGQNSLVYVHNKVAIEIVHRQNIKHDLISSSDDSDDFFGMTAPRNEVGNSNNVSWKVSVDVGFRYLVRLHFSKIGLKMAEIGGLNFIFFINDKIAVTNTDMLLKARDGSSSPGYGDYIVMMTGHKLEGKRDLLIRLQSSEEFMHGPLRRFEILKLSNHDGNLASRIPMLPSRDSTSHTIQILLAVLGHRNAIATVAITIICMVSTIVHKLREVWEASSSEKQNEPSDRARRLCCRFSLSEIQLATRNFSDGLVIGKGGFGKVYKGLTDKERNVVAIKRLKSNSMQGANEFLTEIEMLAGLQHINLVSLIGYCNDNREMMLVYEYMARGTLADHLYNLARRGGDASSLTWKQCLIISVGVARGLDYLHTGLRVIHRDVKASNILLDDNFVAKVSDFGLAKPVDRSKSQSHVTTMVKGTKGYLDPYYLTTKKLTCKSDTYAFGVVLLELLCGRPAVDMSASEDEQILTTWARDKISKGEVDQIVASSLRGEISANSLKTFVGITERCFHDEPKNRPTMSQVVHQLEFALEQQDGHQNLGLNEIASVSEDIQPPTPNDVIHLSSTLQPTVGSKITKSLDRVVNADVISVRKHRGKSTRIKPSKLWPWDALWKRVKPSKKYELLFSDIKLLKFDSYQIAAATDHFSSSNVVGHGRFGAVYKAFLPSGESVAVKRCSPCSAYDLEDLKNEINVLPNLQHRNIIKLHGYCINGEELLLVYDFMANTSLDFFFDKEQQKHLQWALRFQIVMGIARALIYLHQDSGLRVVHGDLNLKNILLDQNMNPKISDFGSARRVVDTQNELETTRIAGTHYDVPPEYYVHGKVSVKTDVYSFGIILLEIVSGRRIFSLYLDLECRSLVEHVSNLWKERRTIELVDHSLGSAFEEAEAIRCIHVALLCIQDHPDHRPSMPSVINMLEGTTNDLSVFV